MPSQQKNRKKSGELTTVTIRYAETGLLVFVWLVLLLTPVLFREDNGKALLNSIASQFEILVPLTLLWLVNRFVLVPRLLFRGSTGVYIASVTGVIFLLAAGSWYYTGMKQQLHPERERTTQFRPGQPPGPPPRPDGQTTGPRPPRAPGPDRQPPQEGGRHGPVPPFANFLIFSVLVVGFDTGLRSALRWIEAENEKERLEKENVESRLSFLRNQVSPHFFMNTLNNIHALVDSSTAEAKEAIIKLSKMMRYLLYETESENTTLKKEVEFIESYVNLMRLRFSERVRITLDLPTQIPDLNIPPFLFTGFIENAFKHGISYRKDSYISIGLAPGTDRLLFSIRNSRADRSPGKDFSGIGIENTRKRLDLLYGNRYHLDIIDNDDSFTVHLTIPV
jgi:hypothetical protein